jgi:transposase
MTWKKDTSGRDIFRFVFRERDCQACPLRERCTHGQVASYPSSQNTNLLPYKPRANGKKQRPTQYTVRAGIEGTISQAVYALRMRRTRYRGLAKTFFQDVATATAMNLVRVVHWLWEIPRSQTRKSRFALLAPG